LPVGQQKPSGASAHWNILVKALHVGAAAMAGVRNKAEKREIRASLAGLRRGMVVECMIVAERKRYERKER